MKNLDSPVKSPGSPGEWEQEQPHLRERVQHTPQATTWRRLLLSKVAGDVQGLPLFPWRPAFAGAAGRWGRCPEVTKEPQFWSCHSSRGEPHEDLLWGESSQAFASRWGALRSTLSEAVLRVWERLRRGETMDLRPIYLEVADALRAQHHGPGPAQ